MGETAEYCVEHSAKSRIEAIEAFASSKKNCPDGAPRDLIKDKFTTSSTKKYSLVRTRGKSSDIEGLKFHTLASRKWKDCKNLPVIGFVFVCRT